MSDIIDRINKLLALASSDNEEEAALAAEHATRLMLKHAITEDQLHGAKHSAVKPIKRTIQLSPPKYTWWQQYKLAAGIAHHLLCQTYYYGRNRTVRSITVVGFPNEVDTVESIYHKLRITMCHQLRCARRHWRNIGWEDWASKTAVNGFCHGFIDGICDRLAGVYETESKTPGAELVFAGHKQAVDDFMAGLGITYPTLRPLLSDSAAYVSGIKAADRADISPSARLNASTGLAVLV